MIDNLEKALALVKKMEQRLPIPAIPPKEMLASLIDTSFPLKKDVIVLIRSVLYMGDDAGIVCEVGTNSSTKKVFLISLTHLYIDPTHSLFPEIFAYQRERISKLNKPSSRSKHSTKHDKTQKNSKEKNSSKHSTKGLFGQLPPCYSFFLNPYEDLRFSKCPRCECPTKTRKFVFVIRIEPKHVLNLGVTSKFCTKCELIILHQNDLEHFLVVAFRDMKLEELIGNKYLVLGTLVDKKKWREELGQVTLSDTLEEISKKIADFKEHVTFKITGGWMPSPEKKK